MRLIFESNSAYCQKSKFVYATWNYRATNFWDAVYTFFRTPFFRFLTEIFHLH